MFSNFSIDINCDVGEGIGNEALLMPYISSCNIACAAHAGSIEVIDTVIALAKKHQVKIGAHPSFPDKANFGRKVLDISLVELQKSLENQITLLIERTQLQNQTLHHIKPHGALYNLIAKDENTAQIVIEAIKNTIANIYLYVPYNSVIATVAQQNGIKIMFETFADRNYNADLTLVSRSKKNALITDKNKVVNHTKRMIIQGKVNTNSGIKTIKTDTICVHGDTKNAVALIKFLHQKLKENHIQVE